MNAMNAATAERPILRPPVADAAGSPHERANERANDRAPADTTITVPHPLAARDARAPVAAHGRGSMPGRARYFASRVPRSLEPEGK